MSYASPVFKKILVASLSIAFLIRALLAQEAIFTLEANRLSSAEIATLYQRVQSRNLLSNGNSLLNSVSQDKAASPCGGRIAVINPQTFDNVLLKINDADVKAVKVTDFLLAELQNGGLDVADEYDCVMLAGDGVDECVPLELATVRAPASVKLPSFGYGTRGDIRFAGPAERKLKAVMLNPPTPIFADDISDAAKGSVLEKLKQQASESGIYRYQYVLPNGDVTTHSDFGEGESSRNNAVRTTAGKFAFEDWVDWLSGARAATDEAMAPIVAGAETWNSALSINQTIRVKVGFASLEQGVIGSTYMPETYTKADEDVAYPAALIDEIMGRDMHPSSPDIMFLYSTNMKFYYGTDGKCPFNKLDLRTTVTHEFCHGLGFSSYHYRGSDGKHPDGTWSTTVPSVFDTFLYYSSGRLPGLSKAQRKAAFTSDALYWDGENAKAANGNKRIKMFAPNQYINGSSVSHWDDSVTFETFMKHASGDGEVHHAVDNRLLGAMKDMGWTPKSEAPTPSDKPDLAIVPFKQNWPAPLYLSKAGEARACTSFAAGSEDIVVNAAVANVGESATVHAFLSRISIVNASGTAVSQKDIACDKNVAPGDFAFYIDGSTWSALSDLRPGDYTLVIEADVNRAISEANESNNIETYAFRVTAAGECPLSASVCLDENGSGVASEEVGSSLMMWRFDKSEIPTWIKSIAMERSVGGRTIFRPEIGTASLMFVGPVTFTVEAEPNVGASRMWTWVILDSFGNEACSLTVTQAGAGTSPERTLSKIAISGETVIASGGSASYVCTAHYSDNTVEKVMPTWSIYNDDGYATIDDSGVLTVDVTPISRWVTVVAEFGGKTDQLTVTVEASPENDDFDNAIVIAGLSGSIEGSNVGASLEDGEPLSDSFAVQRTVWYKWTASYDGKANFDTIGTSFDTLMGIYTGADVAVLQRIATDDDSGGRPASRCQFDCLKGTDYYICIGGYRGDCGTFHLNWRMTDQPDDPTPGKAVLSEGAKAALIGVGSAAGLGLLHVVGSSIYRSVELKNSTRYLGVALTNVGKKEVCTLSISVSRPNKKGVVRVTAKGTIGKKNYTYKKFRLSSDAMSKLPLRIVMKGQNRRAKSTPLVLTLDANGLRGTFGTTEIPCALE